jgi:hypothetical protein
VLRVLPLGARLRAEFWEEFSEAAVGGEGSCSHGPAGRVWTSHSDVATEKSPGANKAPGDWSRDAADYSLGEAAGLASFLAPLAGFTSMFVAVIV